jgi:hypothetical protein
LSAGLADDSKVNGNGTQINAEKAGLTQITPNPWFCLIRGNQRMRSIRFYLRTIKVSGLGVSKAMERRLAQKRREGVLFFRNGLFAAILA